MKKVCLLAIFSLLVFCQVQAQEAEKPTAEIYAYGHLVSSPYNLQIEDEVLKLNGIQVFPEMPSTKNDYFIPEKDALSSDRDAWRDSMFDKMCLLFDQGMSIENIMDEMIAYITSEGSPANYVFDRNGHTFWIEWSGWASEEILVSPCNEAQLKVSMESLQNMQSRWQCWIDNGHIILVNSGITKHIPPNYPAFEEVRQEIHALLAQSDSVLARSWHSQHLERDLAEALVNPRDLPAQED